MWLAHSASDSSLFYGLHKAKPMVGTLEEVWVCPGQPSEELPGWQLASPVVPQGHGFFFCPSFHFPLRTTT